MSQWINTVQRDIYDAHDVAILDMTSIFESIVPSLRYVLGLTMLVYICTDNAVNNGTTGIILEHDVLANLDIINGCGMVTTIEP